MVAASPDFHKSAIVQILISLNIIINSPSKVSYTSTNEHLFCITVPAEHFVVVNVPVFGGHCILMFSVYRSS